METVWGVYLGLDGKPIERTPLSHPYSYESYVLWQKPGVNFKKESEGTVYSDRLFTWDAKKHDELCMKHFGNRGQYWDKREPEKIEAFLRDYWEKPGVELIMIVQCCNQASGYPLWAFYYKGF